MALSNCSPPQLSVDGNELGDCDTLRGVGVTPNSTVQVDVSSSDPVRYPMHSLHPVHPQHQGSTTADTAGLHEAHDVITVHLLSGTHVQVPQGIITCLICN